MKILSKGLHHSFSLKFPVLFCFSVSERQLWQRGARLKSLEILVLRVCGVFYPMISRVQFLLFASVSALVRSNQTLFIYRYGWSWGVLSACLDKTARRWTEGNRSKDIAARKRYIDNIRKYLTTFLSRHLGSRRKHRFDWKTSRFHQFGKYRRESPQIPPTLVYHA